MCGIGGIFFNENKPGRELAGQIGKLTFKIKHRGPDDEGYVFFAEKNYTTAGGKDTPADTWNSKAVYSPQKFLHDVNENSFGCFGFRRLSILDLSPLGHQPMCTADKKKWIVCNGEIYNYVELRSELERKGRTFKTATDTEVILHAWEEWGEDCVQRFNGMWAFVIHDFEKNILFGSRDRFGVKPFYYYHDKHHFAFASEQKALHALDFVQTGINEKHLYRYFVTGNIEKYEEGFFENIFELMPGHSFTFGLKNFSLNIRKYYELEFNTSFENPDAEITRTYSEKIKSLLHDAVRIRLRSDVSIGSCLSGGIDSSAIVALINEIISKEKSEQVGSRIKTFTASFPGQKIDESRWAHIAANSANADSYFTNPDSDKLIEDIETLFYSQDVPIWNTSTYAQFSVMRLASENNVKVVLDGQGGDELFGGYLHYLVPHFRELSSKNEYSKLLREYKSHSGITSYNSFLLKTFFQLNVFPKLPAAAKRGIKNLVLNDLKYLNPDFVSRNKSEQENNNPMSASGLNQILAGEFCNSYLKGYLKCEDRCSMWHSIESRTPFADDINLIEYVFSIPGSYKIQNGYTKFLLRNSLKDMLPADISERKDKMGYNTPNDQWLHSAKDRLREYFTDDISEIIHVKKLHQEYDKLFSETESGIGSRSFKLINFAIWKKLFFPSS